MLLLLSLYAQAQILQSINVLCTRQIVPCMYVARTTPNMV